MENVTEAHDIMALGSALSDPLSAQPAAPGCSTPFVVVPEGYEIRALENLFQTPARRHGNREFNDAGSFARYFNDNAMSEASRIYGTKTPPNFRAVFNDDTRTAPGWKDHGATYKCPLSVEWAIWKNASGKKFTQEEFAAFIEANSPDCVKPAAADMIEISRTLEAKKKVNFASGLRLDNGQSELTYEEEIQGTAAKGRLQIPTEFELGLAVLEGGDRYSVMASLRYRILNGGVLQIWYELVRPHKIVEDAANSVWKLIEDATNCTIYNGG